MKKVFSFLLGCLFIFSNILVEKTFAFGSTYYVLTAVFYDNDEALSKFLSEGLEFEYNDKPEPGKDREYGFTEKKPNLMKSNLMNTIYDQNGNTIITKLIPIDSRRLKTMSLGEKARLKSLIEICMAGIILYDIYDPNLSAFDNYGIARDCETSLKLPFTFNDVFNFLSTVKWGNFVSVYTYNTAKFTDKEKYERRKDIMRHFMCDLEDYYKTDNRWGTRVQSENIIDAFVRIVRAGNTMWVGAEDLIRTQEPVKKFLSKYASVPNFNALIGLRATSSSSSSSSSYSSATPNSQMDECQAIYDEDREKYDDSKKELTREEVSEKITLKKKQIKELDAKKEKLTAEIEELEEKLKEIPQKKSLSLKERWDRFWE